LVEPGKLVGDPATNLPSGVIVAKTDGSDFSSAIPLQGFLVIAKFAMGVPDVGQQGSSKRARKTRLIVVALPFDKSVKLLETGQFEAPEGGGPSTRRGRLTSEFDSLVIDLGSGEPPPARFHHQLFFLHRFLQPSPGASPDPGFRPPGEIVQRRFRS
jgi:hypothetical protein